MKTIIAGSRGIADFAQLLYAIHLAPWHITEIVSGRAKGVDRMGESYAGIHGIPIKFFEPDWSLGKKAGILRNTEMGQYGDTLIALWDGYSRGTKNMIDLAESLLMPMLVANLRDPEYPVYTIQNVKGLYPL